MYIASSDVKQYGGIPDTDTIDDAELTLIIARAQAYVDEYTGRKFSDTDALATRYYTASENVRKSVLWLDKDLFAVGSDGIVAGTDAVASTDYVTEPRNDAPFYALRLTANTPLDWGDSTSDADYENAISVHGYWCYSSDPPADIKHIMLRLTKWFYKQGRTTDETADRPIITESGATIMPTQVPSDITAALERYRYRPVGS